MSEQPKKRVDPAKTGPNGPVYVVAFWHDGPHGHRRVRAHIPLDVVLRHAVSEPTAPDLLSRVVGSIETDLRAEAVLRGVPWER